MTVRKVEKDSLLGCPECGKSDYAVVWDENTKEACYSRELRRAYVSIIGTRGVRIGTTLHYKCPHCGKFINGSKIRIRTAENEGD